MRLSRTASSTACGSTSRTPELRMLSLPSHPRRCRTPRTSGCALKNRQERLQVAEHSSGLCAPPPETITSSTRNGYEPFDPCGRNRGGSERGRGCDEVKRSGKFRSFESLKTNCRPYSSRPAVLGGGCREERLPQKAVEQKSSRLSLGCEFPVLVKFPIFCLACGSRRAGR